MRLYWTTATEINNDYFTVERSNGQEFNKLVRVKGGGNSTEELNYSSSDKKPLDGQSYYRLKQTDFDASFYYSDIVSVTVMPVLSSTIIYPNPTKGEITIKLDHSNSSTDLIIYNQNGNISLVKSFVDAYKSLVKIDLTDDLAPGVYYIQINSGGNTTIQKLLLSK